MPNPRGAVLTDRDRALLAYVAVARYASAEQVHRLFFDGSSQKQTYRRLAKLCRPGGKLGQDACLRRLQFRRRDGTAVPVWALTGYGRGLAEETVSYLREPAASDVGHRFLEHTLLLNGVLAGLVAALRASPTAPLSSLPFRWLCENDSVLEFEIRGRDPMHRDRAVLKPDALLEIPGHSRRLFIEAETGTQSIATAHPARTGAVLAKLQRYAEFFTDFPGTERRPWYERAFPDGYVPRLIFVVHSRDRKQRVTHAVDGRLPKFREREAGLPLRFQVLVLTFAEAASALASYVTAGPQQSTPIAPPRLVRLDEPKVEKAREAFNALLRAMKETWRVVEKHNAMPVAQPLPLPKAAVESFQILRDFLDRELAATTAATPTQSSATAR
jgi:hypothetical protein